MNNNLSSKLNSNLYRNLYSNLYSNLNNNLINNLNNNLSNNLIINLRNNLENNDFTVNRWYEDIETKKGLLFFYYFWLFPSKFFTLLTTIIGASIYGIVYAITHIIIMPFYDLKYFNILRNVVIPNKNIKEVKK